MGCKRFRKILQEYEGCLEAVFIMAGTNDLVDIPRWITLGNLEQLHAMAHAAGAHTVALTIPEISEGATKLYEKEREEINEKLRRFVMQNPERIQLADVAMEFPQDAHHVELWEPDGVHFSPNGYEALGELLAKIFLANIDSGGRFVASPSAPADEA